MRILCTCSRCDLLALVLGLFSLICNIDLYVQWFFVHAVCMWTRQTGSSTDQYPYKTLSVLEPQLYLLLQQTPPARPHHLANNRLGYAIPLSSMNRRQGSPKYFRLNLAFVHARDISLLSQTRTHTHVHSTYSHTHIFTHTQQLL